MKSHKIIDNIEDFNRLFNQPTYHPLVSVGNLAEADYSIFAPTEIGLYCVVLLDEFFGEFYLKGYQMKNKSSSMFAMKPGTIIETKMNKDAKPRGWILAFHPDLLKGTGLGHDFYMFNFFDYEIGETLDLKESERRVVMNCFINLNMELKSPNDRYTSHMLRLGIGQLLSFCRRYYDRQFDTHKLHSSEYITKLEELLDSYLAPNSSAPRTLGQPTVAWCASKFNLTPSYFGDLIRREIGITAQAYIQNKIVERAKALLANQTMSINEIAYQLGFEYPNHFTRFFRQKEGITPTQFRKTIK